MISIIRVHIDLHHLRFLDFPISDTHQFLIQIYPHNSFMDSINLGDQQTLDLFNKIPPFIIIRPVHEVCGVGQLSHFKVMLTLTLIPWMRNRRISSRLTYLTSSNYIFQDTCHSLSERHDMSSWHLLLNLCFIQFESEWFVVIPLFGTFLINDLELLNDFIKPIDLVDWSCFDISVFIFQTFIFLL